MLRHKESQPISANKSSNLQDFFPLPPLQQSEAITVSLQRGWTTFVKRADLCLAAVLLLFLSFFLFLMDS